MKAGRRVRLLLYGSGQAEDQAMVFLMQGQEYYGFFIDSAQLLCYNCF